MTAPLPPRSIRVAWPPPGQTGVSGAPWTSSDFSGDSGWSGSLDGRAGGWGLSGPSDSGRWPSPCFSFRGLPTITLSRRNLRRRPVSRVLPSIFSLVRGRRYRLALPGLEAVYASIDAEFSAGTHRRRVYAAAIEQGEGITLPGPVHDELAATDLSMFRLTIEASPGGRICGRGWPRSRWAGRLVAGSEKGPHARRRGRGHGRMRQARTSPAPVMSAPSRTPPRRASWRSLSATSAAARRSCAGRFAPGSAPRETRSAGHRRTPALPDLRRSGLDPRALLRRRGRRKERPSSRVDERLPTQVVVTRQQVARGLDSSVCEDADVGGGSTQVRGSSCSDDPRLALQGCPVDGLGYGSGPYQH